MDALLRVMFTKIPEEYYALIPVAKLKQLVPGVVKAKAPRKAFWFYGFEKIKTEKYWLLSFFGFKLRKWENNEYHGHPFFLATFTHEGKLIDDYAWWTIEDDDLEVWTCVDVEGDTLLVGYKDNVNSRELDEIWQKVVIGEDGKFEEVYSNFPEGVE